MKNYTNLAFKSFLFLGLFFCLGSNMAFAQGYSETGDFDWEDFEDWANDNGISYNDDYTEQDYYNDYIEGNDIQDWDNDGDVDGWDVNYENINDYYPDANYDWDNDGDIDADDIQQYYDGCAGLNGDCSQNEMCMGCPDEAGEEEEEDSGDVCDPDSVNYSMCDCAESLGSQLCECDPTYCDAVNDPCASPLADIDECECYGVNCETVEADPCDVNGGAYNPLKCIIKDALEEEVEESENNPCVNLDPAGEGATITSDYGVDRSVGSSPHRGIDYGIATGTSVSAMGGGNIVRSGWSSTYGWTVIIDHGTGVGTTEHVYTLYAHLKEGTLNYVVGNNINRSDIIGESNNSGSESHGAHLHVSAFQCPTNIALTSAFYSDIQYIRNPHDLGNLISNNCN